MSFLLRTDEMARAAKARWPHRTVRSRGIDGLVQIDGLEFSIEFLEDVGLDGADRVLRAHRAREALEGRSS